MRTVTAAAAFLLVSSSSYAQDPTFNGLFEALNCNFQQMVLCDGAFCRPVDNSEQDLMNLVRVPLEVNFKAETVRRSRDRNVEATPLEIEAISEAALGKPLWVRFRTSPDGQNYKIQTTYLPQGAQGYRVMAAMQTTIGSETAIITGNCSPFKPR